MKDKTLFEILNEMHQQDVKNKTSLVGVCLDFISSDLTRRGTEIKMGAPREVSMDLLNGKKIPVLLLIDKDAYNFYKNHP